MSLRYPSSVTSATHVGQRPYQEDRLLTATLEQGTLLAVFDGHGGAQVSHFASEELPAAFADEIAKPKAKPRTAISKAVYKIALETEYMESGSTLSLAFIPSKSRFVYCAVVGDSPIIVRDSRGGINIGPDHNVRTNEEEKKAAVARGGFVSDDGYLFQHFNGPGLQMARALGDSRLRQVLSRVPDIYKVPVNGKSWVLVGTDGLFDPGHHHFREAAAKVVEEIEDGAEAQALVDAAISIPTGDNVSCILARFGQRSE